MRNSVRNRGGAHRKRTRSTIGRIALATAASAAVSTAAAGAAAAQPAEDSGIRADDAARGDAAAAPAGLDAEARILAGPHPGAAADTPTVVSVRDHRPAVDLAAQLATALQYNYERVQRDLAERAPLLARPTEGVLTSGFGGRWGTMHNGIDIANVMNTPIMSVLPGEVIDAGPAQGFGQWVRVLHDDGAISVYGHIESIYVTVGERVQAGQVIAGMGNRGFSTGTHLHFEIHPDGVTPVDPLAWLAARGIIY